MMKNTGWGFVLALVLSLFLLSGCGSTPKLTEPEGKQPSLMYGYIDMSDAPTDLDWVTMKRMRPVTDTSYYNFWVLNDGTFFLANVPTGTYKFTKFGGFSGWKNASYEYGFPHQGKGMLDRRIRRKGMYYVGSYKYVKVKTGWLKASKFDIKRTKSPTELELLQKVLPYSKHEHWTKMIETRIGQLERKKVGRAGR